MDYDKKEKMANRIMAVFMLAVIIIFMAFQVMKGGDDGGDAAIDASPTPTTEATVEPAE